MPGSFMDTNVLLYAIASDDPKRHATLAILAEAPTISTQVLNEAANVMRRKMGYTIEQIRLLLRMISVPSSSFQ